MLRISVGMKANTINRMSKQTGTNSSSDGGGGNGGSTNGSMSNDTVRQASTKNASMLK